MNSGKSPKQTSMTPEAGLMRRIWVPQITFVLSVIGVFLIGLGLYQNQRDHIRAHHEAQLVTIGEQRIEQLTHWMTTVRNSMEFFGQGGQVADHFQAWSASGYQDVARLEKIRARLASFESAFGHHGITLFDVAGVPRFNETQDPFMSEHQGNALTVMRSRSSILVDFHLHGQTSKEPMLGMMVPLIAGRGASEQIVGAMFFRISPQTSLFPQLSRWPTPSASGETVLARAEGEQVRVLYASRQTQPIDLLSFKQYPALAAVRALRGEQGLLRGATDRAGRPMLAFGGKVPGTSWVLIARMTQAEVDAPLQRLVWMALAVFVVLVLLSGILFRRWWRGQLDQQRAQLLGKDIERGVLERRYDTLSHYSSDSILLLDAEGIVLEANQRVETMYGYRVEELLGQSIFLLLTPERQVEYYQRREELLASGKLRFESEHQRKDGSRLMVEVSAHAIELHGVSHMHLTIHDISERKQVENRLLMQSLVLDQIQDTVTITNLDGVITYVNEALCKGSGFARESLIGQSVSLFGNDQKDEPSQAEIVRMTLEQGSWRGKLTNLRTDGTKIFVELRTTLIRDSEGQPISMVGIGTDVSERIARQQALEEREALYRGIIETSRDGFWITDMEDRLLEVNAAYCQRSGFSREELLSMHIGDLEAEERPPDISQHREKMVRDGGDLFETRHRARDGSVWQVEVNTSYSPLQGGRIFVFLRDILRRNRSDALLRARLHLADIAAKGDLDALMQASLDTAELHTDSHIGFFHFVDPDQQNLTLQIWSSNTIDRMCSIEARQQAKGQHYPIAQAGIWADCVRQRQTLIHNDYAAMSGIKGLPEGHAPLLRELVVPILRDDRVIAVLGVGNKASDYAAEDVSVVEQIASITMDLVARKHAEVELQRSNDRLIDAQRAARMGNWEYDVQRDQIGWSEQALEVMGIDPARGPLGYREAATLYHPEDVPRFHQVIDLALQEGTPSQIELRVVHPDGEIRSIWATCQAVKNPEGRVIQLFGTVQDISERKQSEARLEQATHFDVLTGLPNSRGLFRQMQQDIDHAESEHVDSETLALLVLNVDRFSQLNESLGRTVGDSVLKNLAQRWSALLPGTALLARLDADQFAVFWRAQRDPGAAADDAMFSIAATANLLLASMAEPISIGETVSPVLLTISIGIAVYPGDAGAAADLLHAAEDAMRSAKADKGNQIRFFDRRYAEKSIDWFETEAALRLALEHDELFLAYQPQVDAANGRIVAAEALLRWRRNGEVVPPVRFIQVVENTDLAEPVSRWVLNAACRQARQWLDRKHPLRLAVNIFSDHVTSGRLFDDVRQALAANGLPPELLEIEVVESSLLKNPELAAQTLREIKRLGVGLALDDFGTGYSSLGYLKHYPFDMLKIDQMFARNVTRDPEDAAIVRSTIALAHNLGMRVLAEGVETDPQLQFMARYGCDHIQGYLTSRPVTPDAVETINMERRDLRPSGANHAAPLHTILIIEDEPIEAEMMAMLLNDSGYGTECVADLEAALTVMGQRRIDLIVSDYYLDKITGVDVLERLRRLFPDVPRIMVSGADDSAIVMEAVNRCAIQAFLPKPVEPEQLLAHLRHALGRSEPDRNPAR
jgi:PAS domain S-box-containing protein/diguanylate cyclase (GGDEF)-like protein